MKGKRIAFGDIVGVETVSFDENDLGVKPKVVPCFVVGGTEDGYILRYMDKNGLEEYTVSKDVLQIRPTQEWAMENGFEEMHGNVWCFAEEQQNGLDDGERQEKKVHICFNEKDEKIVGDGPLTYVTDCNSFTVSTVQEVFSLIGIEKEFCLAGL